MGRSIRHGVTNRAYVMDGERLKAEQCDKPCIFRHYTYRKENEWLFGRLVPIFCGGRLEERGACVRGVRCGAGAYLQCTSAYLWTSILEQVAPIRFVHLLRNYVGKQPCRGAGAGEEIKVP